MPGRSERSEKGGEGVGVSHFRHGAPTSAARSAAHATRTRPRRAQPHPEPSNPTSPTGSVGPPHSPGQGPGRPVSGDGCAAVTGCRQVPRGPAAPDGAPPRGELLRSRRAPRTTVSARHTPTPAAAPARNDGVSIHATTIATTAGNDTVHQHPTTSTGAAGSAGCPAVVVSAVFWGWAASAAEEWLMRASARAREPSLLDGGASRRCRRRGACGRRCRATGAPARSRAARTAPRPARFPDPRR